MVIWGVYTTDDERGGSIKCYCKTRKLAERELKKYTDWYCEKSPEPDEKHIRKIEVKDK